MILRASVQIKDGSLPANKMGRGLKIFFIVQGAEYFITQMLRGVYEDSLIIF